MKPRTTPTPRADAAGDQADERGLPHADDHRGEKVAAEEIGPEADMASPAAVLVGAASG